MSLEASITEMSVALIPPAIGQVWPGQGGIYAGLKRGRDGAPDYHLIAGPQLPPSDWSTAKSAAAALSIDGHNDFTLPFRAEQSLLFANVPELFEKDWYWSCEEHAAFPDYAWMQGFDNGGQYLYRKSNQYRACAVRRLEIFRNDAQV